MIFIKSKKVDINMKFVNDIVKAYFECLRENNLSLSCSEISELLRYSMCKILNLQSKGYSNKIEESSKIVVNSLSILLKNYNIDDMTNDYKSGLLEACVHCMEMSRKEVLS